MDDPAHIIYGPSQPEDSMLTFTEWRKLSPEAKLLSRHEAHRRYGGYCERWRNAHRVAEPKAPLLHDSEPLPEDWPGGESAVIDRATWDNLWIQMCGRAQRPTGVVIDSNSEGRNWVQHFIGLGGRPPMAWFRGHTTHSPDGDEYDEEFVSGPDQPSPDASWVPLYPPLTEGSAAADVFNDVHKLANDFIAAGEENKDASIKAADVVELLGGILNSNSGRRVGKFARERMLQSAERGSPEYVEAIADRLMGIAAEVEALDDLSGGTGQGVAQTLRGRAYILREVAKLRRIKQG